MTILNVNLSLKMHWLLIHTMKCQTIHWSIVNTCLNSFQWNHFCFIILRLFTTQVKMQQKAKRASKDHLIKFVEGSWPGKRKKADETGRQPGFEREKRAKYEQELCPESDFNNKWWEKIWNSWSIAKLWPVNCALIIVSKFVLIKNWINMKLLE